MHFNFDVIKKHPAVIAAILFGAFILYRLYTSSGSNSQAASTDTASQQIQAASAAQANTNAAGVQAAQIAANSQDGQTQASVQINQDNLAAKLAELETTLAATKYQADSGVAVAGMQQTVALAQIDASNRQAALNDAIVAAQTKAAADIESQYLDHAYTIAAQRERDYQANVDAIIPQAGQKKNSALDASNQTAIFETILSGGNPGVAVSGNGVTATADASGNNSSVAKTAAITGAITNVASKLIDGLF